MKFLRKMIIRLVFWIPTLIFMAFGIGFLVYGVGTLITQIKDWLKDGVWVPCPLGDVTPTFILDWCANLEWVSIQKIIGWLLLHIPGQIFLIIFSFIVCIIGIWLSLRIAMILEEKWKTEVVTQRFFS